MELFSPTAEFVNAVINAPDVRPTVQRGLELLDCAPFLEECRNAAVAYRGGVMLFEHVERGVYEGHVFCLAAHRGAEALRFGKLGISWLFSKVGADKLLALAPYQLPAVRFYCRRLGLRAVDRDLFQEYFEVEAQQWVA